LVHKLQDYEAEAPIKDITAAIDVKDIRKAAVKLDNFLFNTFYSTPSIQLLLFNSFYSTPSLQQLLFNSFYSTPSIQHLLFNYFTGRQEHFAFSP
jgi:hypothetical protein